MKQRYGLLEVLLRALTEHFPLDHTAPGLVLAYLPDKQCFYGSIARYDGVASRDNPPLRQIIKSVQEETLADTVKELATLWCGSMPASDQLIKSNKGANNGKIKVRKRAKSTPTRKSKLRRAESKGRRA